MTNNYLSFLIVDRGAKKEFYANGFCLGNIDQAKFTNQISNFEDLRGKVSNFPFNNLVDFKTYLKEIIDKIEIPEKDLKDNHIKENSPLSDDF